MRKNETSMHDAIDGTATTVTRSQFVRRAAPRNPALAEYFPELIEEIQQLQATVAIYRHIVDRMTARMRSREF